jgi:opacity protein-like surface antigen
VPYIGAGLGYGLAGLKYADFDDSYEWKAWNDKRYGGLNYNFTIGAAYAVTDRLSADLGLRYTEQIMLDDGPWKTSFNAYSVLLGARYMF